MFNIVEKRRWYFLASALVISVGITVMIYSTMTTGGPFRLSIVFTGGSNYEFQFIEDGATESTIRDVFAANGEDNVIIQRLGGVDSEWLVAGELEAPVVSSAFAPVFPEVGVELVPTEEIVYVLTFDEGFPLDTLQLQDTFRDGGAGSAFVRPAGDLTWSVVVDGGDVTDADDVAETLVDAYNAAAERLESPTFDLIIDQEEVLAEDVNAVLEPLNAEFVQRRPYRWSVRASFQAEQSIWWVAGDLGSDALLQAAEGAVIDDVTVEVVELPQVMYEIPVGSEGLASVEQTRAVLNSGGLEEIYVRSDAETGSSFQVIVGATDSEDAESLLSESLGDDADTLSTVPGAVYELSFNDDSVELFDVQSALSDAGLDAVIAEKPYQGTVFGGDADTLSQRILNDLNEIAEIDFGSLRIDAVDETVGQEVTQAAFVAVGLAAIVITGFIVLAFRQIPKATRYGLCAIAAMVHDVLIVMGVMSLMGLIAGWEIDDLFLTAILTVVGFSVQDSIVVFDRIRENIPKHIGEPYETIVNRSIWETIHRSLATQLNAFFVMAAILLFGGETIRQFIAILFFGLLSGTYSSIFTAVPLLVAWEKGEIPFLKGESALAAAEA